MKTDLDTITFDELRTLDDTNQIIWTGVIINKSDIPEIKEMMDSGNDKLSLGNRCPLLNKGEVIDVKVIDGNVLGEEGRMDCVIFFKDAEINIMQRLQMAQEFKWVSDFVDNYASDYEV